MTTEARDAGLLASLERLRLVAFAAAAVFLGYALHIYNGTLADRRAMSALCAAIACSAAGVFARRATLRGAARLWIVLTTAGVLYGGYALLTPPPVAVNGAGRPFALQLAIGAAIVLAVTALRRRPPLGRFHVPLLLAVYFCAGVWVIHGAGAPSIDVYEFHQEGLKALLAGRSPYSTTIPNLYGSEAPHFYGASLVAAGRVHVGYPYPPVNLFLALPGHLAGDYRYALVAAIVLAAGLIAGLHDRRSARAGAALLLFCPRAFFVCEQGWTEPFVAVTLAAVIFCALRARRRLPFALAAFVASKQYAILALPAVALLFSVPVTPAGLKSCTTIDRGAAAGTRVQWREAARVVAIALALACAAALPFAVADPKGFVDSVLLFQLQQPLRSDSLSLLVKIPGGVGFGSSFSVAAAAAALAACLWRAPRNAVGFAGSLAFVFLLFFASAKQSFWNYYFFVFSAVACAVGGSDSQD